MASRRESRLLVDLLVVSYATISILSRITLALSENNSLVKEIFGGWKLLLYFSKYLLSIVCTFREEESCGFKGHCVADHKITLT